MEEYSVVTRKEGIERERERWIAYDLIREKINNKSVTLAKEPVRLDNLSLKG